MESSELAFDGLGGSCRARWLGPARPSCVIGVVPALGLRADYYQPLAEALASESVAVVTADLPGHGQSPIRAGRAHDWGYRELVEHLGALRQTVQARASGARFVWLGHSIGGQVALMEGGHDGSADAVVVVASGPPYFRLWPGLGALRVLSLTQFGALTAAALGHFPGETLGFGGREARTLIAEWATAARTGRYVFVGFDGDGAIARLDRPVLAIRVEGDTLAPENAMAHTLAKAVRARVELGSLPRTEQDEKVRLNPHNRWPRSPASVVRQVKAFLERHQLFTTAPETHA